MNLRQSLTRLLEAASAGLAVPLAAKAGAIVITVGLGLDMFEHRLGHDGHDALIGAFPLGEHIAHLVVIAGMVLVLAGIVADGIRMQRRLARQEGRDSRAIR